MKTITRKPGWPKWGKYYAVDHHFGAWVHLGKPEIDDVCRAWFCHGAVRRLHRVRGYLLSDRKTWRTSLRWIKEVSHG